MHQANMSAVSEMIDYIKGLRLHPPAGFEMVEELTAEKEHLAWVIIHFLIRHPEFDAEIQSLMGSSSI